jgi:hypothetical protein
MLGLCHDDLMILAGTMEGLPGGYGIIPARHATFYFGDKYRQMESSDVVMKISRYVNRF